jgi:hypothetical protein
MNSPAAATGFTSPKHYFAYGALCVLWGSTWIAVRVLVRDVPPFRAAAIRFVLAGAILGVVGSAMKLPFPRSAREWRNQVILGITMMAVPYGAVFWAEQHINASLTALLFASFPLVVAIWSPILTGQTVPRWSARRTCRRPATNCITSAGMRAAHACVLTHRIRTWSGGSWLCRELTRRAFTSLTLSPTRAGPSWSR